MDWLREASVRRAARIVGGMRERTCCERVQLVSGRIVGDASANRGLQGRGLPCQYQSDPSRTEPSQTEPNRAEPSRTEPIRAEPIRADPTGATGRSFGPCPMRVRPRVGRPRRARRSFKTGVVSAVGIADARRVRGLRRAGSVRGGSETSETPPPLICCVSSWLCVSDIFYIKYLFTHSPLFPVDIGVLQ